MFYDYFDDTQRPIDKLEPRIGHSYIRVYCQFLSMLDQRGKH